MSLLELQEDFRRWLTVEAPSAAARLGKSAAPGLSIYLNNYRSQLMACLAESYDKVHAWLGDAAFDSVAATHVDSQPPRSWTLDDYSIGFPATLDRLYPDDPEVGDLARLELELGRSFVGADSAPLDPAALEDVDWELAILVPAPTFAILPVRTNAAAIWSALEAGDAPPSSELLSVPATIAIWRQEFVATFRTLDAIESVALALVAQGRTFAAICATLAEEIGEEEAPATAGAFLAQWMNEGIIGAIAEEPGAQWRSSTSATNEAW